MYLSAIEAKNYRTFEDIRIEFAKNYSTISGQNNAGKSHVIRLLSALFTSGLPSWTHNQSGFEYVEDCTQWSAHKSPIEVTYHLALSRDEDPALISFVEKIANISIASPDSSLEVHYRITEGDEFTVSVKADGVSTDEKAAKEIDKRIKDSNLLFLYNSTTPHEDYYFSRRGRPQLFYDLMMSKDEKKELDDANQQVHRKLRKFVKEHTQGLSDILEKLREKYNVEFSAPESMTSRRMPLSISLSDSNVEVPLADWGSGTQNRTHILRAVLQAYRIKRSASTDDRITPFALIEEPESFLHPTAQAEFGKVLRQLSADFGIQIIATTHSPYMLNQEDPSSNILLCRTLRRKKPYQSTVVPTSNDHWMAPFAEHLGLPPAEFSQWRALFSSHKLKVLLVEGSIDKEYFEYIRSSELPVDKLHSTVEVEAYGGKDTLKNTLLLQFVLRQFDRVYVTYDLDAANDVKAALARLGMKEGVDHMPLGINHAGKDCIEGLLPQSVLNAVNGRETDLVMSLGGQNATERRNAKEKLKQKYLEEFKSRNDWSKEDLKQFNGAIKTINARIAAERQSHKKSGAATT